MTIKTRLIAYQHGEATLEGLFAWDDNASGPKPVVLISHAWSGRSEFDNDKAMYLASLGYCAFALDMYGKGVRGNSLEENQALIAPFVEDRQLLRDRIGQAVKVAQQQTEVDAAKVAAIGFCFGGMCVLDLARDGAEVAGVVSLHGLFMPAEKVTTKAINAKVLCLHGYDDPMVPPEQVIALAKELTDAGADWQIHAYGNTKHAFTNPMANDPDFGTVYCATAEKRALTSLENFLAELF